MKTQLKKVLYLEHKIMFIQVLATIAAKWVL